VNTELLADEQVKQGQISQTERASASPREFLAGTGVRGRHREKFPVIYTVSQKKISPV